jgi:hypothetical protein
MVWCNTLANRHVTPTSFQSSAPVIEKRQLDAEIVHI